MANPRKPRPWDRVIALGTCEHADFGQRGTIKITTGFGDHAYMVWWDDSDTPSYATVDDFILAPRCLLDYDGWRHVTSFRSELT